MEQPDSDNRLAKAAEEFNRHEPRKDGTRVAGCLAGGLTILRDSLFLRMHHEVERAVGIDSMLMPVSEVKTKQQATRQIEAYQIAESAAAASHLGYVETADDWYFQWLARLRLGRRGLDARILEQSKGYLAETSDRRRLAFSDMLGRVLPESRHAPLVLFRLFPLSIQIVTACAFGDRGTASGLRRQQTAILPAITDCRECRGQLLECTEQCSACGNPLWKYDWLTAVD